MGRRRPRDRKQDLRSFRRRIPRALRQPGSAPRRRGRFRPFCCKMPLGGQSWLPHAPQLSSWPPAERAVASTLTPQSRCGESPNREMQKHVSPLVFRPPRAPAPQARRRDAARDTDVPRVRAGDLDFSESLAAAATSVARRSLARNSCSSRCIAVRCATAVEAVRSHGELPLRRGGCGGLKQAKGQSSAGGHAGFPRTRGGVRAALGLGPGPWTRSRHVSRTRARHSPQGAPRKRERSHHACLRGLWFFFHGTRLPPTLPLRRPTWTSLACAQQPCV